MSLYTLRGSEELDAQINQHLEHITRTVSSQCDALVLTGSYARGEGTPFIHPDGSQSPFNDYDLVAIVDRSDNQVRVRFNDLEKELTADVGLHVDLCPYSKKHLSKCAFSLFNYEMKHGHKVLQGDPHVLDAMPDYPHNAIPEYEGSRLLLNRGKLLLDIKLRLAEPAPLTDEERIRFIKFICKAWLALGDCALLSERNYDLSYAVKRERIASVGTLPHRTLVIDEYIKAIELKNWSDYYSRLPDTDVADELQRVRSVLLDVLAWYRRRHAVRECSRHKAMLLNLKYNRWPYLSHPRVRLYDALNELLQDVPDKILLSQILSCSDHFEKRFYDLRERFS